LFPGIGFVVTHSRLPAAKMAEVSNGPNNVENRIKLRKATPC